MSRQLRIAVATLASIAVTTLIGACSSESGGGSAAGASHGGASAPDAGAPAAGGVAGRYAPASPVPSATHAYAASTNSGARLTAVEIGTAKIRIANMTVQVKRGTTVADQANTAEAIANGAGGEVDADDRSSGRFATATLVLRVPPEQLTATLNELSKLGVEKGRRLSTQDVTSKVADVNSRVSSAKGAITRLRVLYQRASKVSDVINIESELSQRESDLESLQAQQRALSAETSTASITLTLTSAPRHVVHKVAPKHHHNSGFLAGLSGGWHAFITGAKAVATAAGALLPFAILVLILGLGARWVWPRLRPARAPAPAPAPPQ